MPQDLREPDTEHDEDPTENICDQAHRVEDGNRVEDESDKSESSSRRIIDKSLALSSDDPELSSEAQNFEQCGEVGSSREEELPSRSAMDAQGLENSQGGSVPSSEIAITIDLGAQLDPRKIEGGSNTGRRRGTRRTIEEVYDGKQPFQRSVRQKTKPAIPSSSSLLKTPGALSPNERNLDNRDHGKAIQRSPENYLEFRSKEEKEEEQTEADEEDPQGSPMFFGPRFSGKLDPASLGATIAKHFCSTCSEYIPQQKDGVSTHQCLPSSPSSDG